MWPKLLAQLFELLPHITRLVPVADRYFSSRAASEKANVVALAAMAEGVQADLGQVTKAHAGLYRQLQEHGNQIAEVSGSVRAMQAAVEKQEERIEALDKRLASANLWIKFCAALILALVVLVAVLLLRH